MKKSWSLAIAPFALLALALLATAAFAVGTPVASTATADLADAAPMVDTFGLPMTVLDSLEAAAKCPRPGVYCLDVWDPVTCSNGVTYSNACYAYRACATGCSAGGVLL